MSTRFSPKNSLCKTLCASAMFAAATFGFSAGASVEKGMTAGHGTSADKAVIQLADDIIVRPELRIDGDGDSRFRIHVETPGHYEHQHVLVREGYYETYDVWVPEHRDFLGLRVRGHYETRGRWIPARYEEREIFVPDER